MDDPLRATLVELVEALRTKRVSATELLERTLHRVRETRDALNAMVALRDEEACRAEARASDERIASGEARPLEGVPFAVKDLEDVAGLPTTHGSRLFADQIAQHDSVQVERLRAAGAIVIGKTNTPEFGHTAITKNLVYGVTRSPWDPERSPGGSSGGASALVAGEVVPLCTASDGGGSIRIPASFTGTFGLKPSFGRVARGPWEEWNYGMTGVWGPLTKTVADAAYLLDQIVGHDPRDPVSLPHPGYSYVQRIAEQPPAGLKIGFSADLGYANVQSDIADVVEDAARALEQLGHHLEPIPDGPPEMGGHWGILGAFEVLSRIDSFLPERRDDISRSLMGALDMARGITPHWWGEQARLRGQLVQWAARAFEQWDVLVTPTVPFDPPPARGPFPSETEGKPQPAAGVAAFTIPFNLTWHPAASVRAGMSRAGLPVGMQIVAPLHREDLLLKVAAAFERERPWHPHWPLRDA